MRRKGFTVLSNRSVRRGVPAVLTRVAGRFASAAAAGPPPRRRRRNLYDLDRDGALAAGPREPGRGLRAMFDMKKLDLAALEAAADQAP